MRLRENKIEIQGRSLLLNILAVILNILGVFFIAKGFHISAGDSALAFKLIGFVLLVGGVIGLIALKGMYMFSYVARAFVGGLFIVSGLVKANDPWGFAFKLEEYFSPMGLAYDFPFFESFSPWVLEISILVCIAEIVLGIAVIVGAKIKLTSWLLVFMMIFFTWLTYYTFSCVETNELLREAGKLAERDCVTDCGCFGDALKGSVGRSLTPYESFWKDIVLFYFVIIIFFNQRKIEINTYKENWVMGLSGLLVVVFFSWVFGWYFPILFYILTLLGAHIFGNMNLGNLKKPWKMALFVSFISLLFSLYTTNYLPVKDYRAYAIGNNIQNEMDKGEAEVVEYQLIYKNKSTGAEQFFDVGEYSVYGDTEVWEYLDRKETLIKAGVDAPITDFVLATDYSKLSNMEKENPILDSIIQEEFEGYYESKIIVNSGLGIDTISEYEYVPYLVDTSKNEDTIFFEKSDQFYGLLDPSAPYSVDMTQYILSLEKVIIVTIRDITSYNSGAIDDLKKVYNQSKENGIPFYILTPATDSQMNDFRTSTGLTAPYLAIDGTEIKIIVRSNPGLVLLKKGTIIEKWGSRSIPSYNTLGENF
ncbi:MAG: MauE/DoxX family redox-associated membrane protein [Crocinitomicaceae bacterium]